MLFTLPGLLLVLEPPMFQWKIIGKLYLGLFQIRPFLINELEAHLLHDRRKVYECLERYGIPIPRYALVNGESPYQEVDYFVEEEDFVEVFGNRFWKPFVEKPVDVVIPQLSLYRQPEFIIHLSYVPVLCLQYDVIDAACVSRLLVITHMLNDYEATEK